MPAFLVAFAAAIPEEAGWRGFALPGLRDGHGRIVASLVVGALWAAWHLPLLLKADNPMSSYPVAAFAAVVVARSFVYTWLFEGTGGSVLLVTLFHAMSNTIGGFVPAEVIVTGVVALLIALWWSRKPLADERRTIGAAARGRTGRDVTQPGPRWGRATLARSRPPPREGRLGVRRRRTMIRESKASPGGSNWWARTLTALVLVAFVALPAWAQDLPTRTPEEQGIDSARLAEGLLSLREQGVPIHSLLMIRDGAVVVDAYFYPYDGSAPHDLASETKSVMTTLIGIAAEQGALSLDAPVFSFFPEREVANRDARKERMTVAHLTSMTSGLDCSRAENEPLTQEMLAAPDAVQFALDRPMAAEPGTRFAYCNLGSHLLSAVLQEATGRTALDFAGEHLFGPLGIAEVMWPTDQQGVSRGWGDLHLHPRDIAKLGLLWLEGGEWNGERVVPREWVDASVTHQVDSDSEDGYGHGWWLTAGASPGEYRADGRGGQYTIVLPSIGLVVQTTGGGFEGDALGPALLPALVDMERPLPPNPAGVAQLEAALAAIAQPPVRQPVPPLPATAGEVSDRTVVLEANPLTVETIRFDFDGSPEAGYLITLAGRDEPLAGSLGLDGVYRMSPGDRGLPAGVRGAWVDERIFVFEYDTIASIDAYTFRLRFEQDGVAVDVTTREGESFSVEGRMEGR